MKPSKFIVGICLLLFLGGIYIFGISLNQEHKDLPVAESYTKPSPSIPVERGVFTRAGYALDYQNMPEGGDRNLNNYYYNRSFIGGPPIIPHPLVAEKGIGGKDCLQCHQNGGYVDQFKAFAPVTPHPEFVNCKQCHVPQKTEKLFKKSDWAKTRAPPIHQVAFEGGPPVIPHGLQLRENCLSCHAGPATPREIKTSHPERVNCRQCHLPKNTNDLFQKPAPAGKGFIRPENKSGKIDLEESEVRKISEYIRNRANKNQ